MTRYAMTPRQAQEIAKLFRERRDQLGLSTRQVAARAGTSHGTVNSLEHALSVSPRPDIFKAVAGALGLSLSDIFSIADWLQPDELPSLQPYLRAKYGLGKRDAAKLDDYLTRLQARHGSQAGSGPLNGEDEH